MYPPPAGKDLTPEQARALDDTFLSSDPFGYFRSRIGSLLAWHENAPFGDGTRTQAAEGTVRAQFNSYLRSAAGDGLFSELDVHAQVAADALAVRHHAAEALLRLACARLAPATAAVPCLWAEIASGPFQIADVIARLADRGPEQDEGEAFLPLRRASGRCGGGMD